MPLISKILKKEIVVIIGGPGTGKTTIIDGLIAQNYCCYPEISRQVTLEAQKQGIEQLFLKNPLLFSELLLEGRKKQFENACNEPHDMVFLDRGIPDVLAYMHYIGRMSPKNGPISGGVTWHGLPISQWVAWIGNMGKPGSCGR